MFHVRYTFGVISYRAQHNTPSFHWAGKKKEAHVLLFFDIYFLTRRGLSLRR